MTRAMVVGGVVLALLTPRAAAGQQDGGDSVNWAVPALVVVGFWRPVPGVRPANGNKVCDYTSRPTLQ